MEQGKSPIQFSINPKARATLDFVTEIRGQGEFDFKIDIEKDPELCKLIIDLITLGKSQKVAIPKNYIKELFETGILVENYNLPNNIKYKCILEEQSLPLTQAGIPKNIDGFRINPVIFLQTDAYIPPDFKARIFYNNCFSSDLPVLWVEEPRTKMLMPFWLTENNKELIIKFLREDLAITQLSKDLLTILYLAKIILPPLNTSPNNDITNEKLFISGREEHEAKGYTIIRELLNPLQTNALKNYYLELSAKGNFKKGDFHVNSRDSMANEVTGSYIHHQMLNFINCFTPEKVKCSYCYISIYHPGSVLSRHTDREQCKWNLSLVLDMEPEQDRSEAWPLFIEKNGVENAVRLGKGDAVLYQGTEVPHWRERLPDNQRYLIFFFHFVNEDFSGSLT